MLTLDFRNVKFILLMASLAATEGGYNEKVIYIMYTSNLSPQKTTPQTPQSRP
jgi:hypothetical protein